MSLQCDVASSNRTLFAAVGGPPLRGVECSCIALNVPSSVALHASFLGLEVSPGEQQVLHELMEPLRLAHPDHYEHSVRVALCGKEMAEVSDLDGRAMLFAGLLHDIGKAPLPHNLVSKCGQWSERDREAIKAHVLLGYNQIRGRFDLTAEIMLLHHTFQPEGYPNPEELPPYLHDYSAATRDMIACHARHLALADCFDALHRPNCCWGDRPMELSREEILGKMLQIYPSEGSAIERFARAGVF